MSYIEKEAYFFESYVPGDFPAYVIRMKVEKHCNNTVTTL
jgi:hypothetical protein